MRPDLDYCVEPDGIGDLRSFLGIGPQALEEYTVLLVLDGPAPCTYHLSCGGADDIVCVNSDGILNIWHDGMGWDGGEGGGHGHCHS